MSNPPEENDPADRIAPPDPDAGRDSNLPIGTRRRPSFPRDEGNNASPYPVTGRGYGCADVITAIFLLLSVASVSLTILLIANPRSPLNPFPAPTLPIPF